MVEIRFLCNVIDTRALIGPCSHVTSRCCQSATPGMSPASHYSAYSNWSLATYPFFSLSKPGHIHVIVDTGTLFFLINYPAEQALRTNFHIIQVIVPALPSLPFYCSSCLAFPQPPLGPSPLPSPWQPPRCLWYVASGVWLAGEEVLHLEGLLRNFHREGVTWRWRSLSRSAKFNPFIP